MYALATLGILNPNNLSKSRCRRPFPNRPTHCSENKKGSYSTGSDRVRGRYTGRTTKTKKEKRRYAS